MKMPPCFRWIMIALLCPIILTLPGCSSGEDDDGGNTSPYSVGGTVRGLDGAGLILQLNGVENLNVSIDGPFNFASQVSGNTSYNVTVSAQPTSPNQFCTVGKGSGNGANGNVSDVIVNCSSVMPVYQENGSNWLDHVISSNTAAACTLDVANDGLGACIHGGELRTWTSNIAASDCTGITVSDILGVFNWVCEINSGLLVARSTGLKNGKKLSDLIDFTAAPPQWKLNHVILTGASTSSTPEIWWANPIITTSGGGGGLTQTGGIYLINASTTGGYTFRTNKSALVINPSATLTSPTNTYAVYGQDLQYLWLEGKINGNGVGRGVLFSSVAASVIRNVTVSNSINPGIELDYAQGNQLIDIVSEFNGSNSYQGVGIYLYECWKNAVVNASTSSNFDWGVALNRSNNNRLTGVTASNNGSSGLYFVDAANNVAANVTATNNASRGVFLTNSPNTTNPSVNNLLIGVVSANNGRAGVELSVDSNNNTLADMAAAHNFYPGVGVFSSGNYVTGLLKVGGNNADNANPQCVGGPGTGLNGDCTAEVPSDVTPTLGITLASSFVATSPALGDVGPMTRGAEGSAFPADNNRGACSVTAGCVDWHWGLMGTDTVLRATLSKPTGSTVLTHRWVATNSTLCGFISGAVWNSGASECTSMLLRHAVELSGDGVGNDDLLCQSNETCLWTKNIGAYQGHGPLISAGSFDAGTLTGISLLEFTTNGN